MNEDIKTIYQNIWDNIESVLRGKFNSVNAHVKKLVKYQVKEPMTHVKALEKQYPSLLIQLPTRCA